MLLEERGEGQGIYSESGEKAPTRVEWVPRLKDDVESLMRFMHMKTLPKPVARPPRKATVVYSFGDASGSGFRSSLAIGDSIHYQSGQWRPKINQESSNFRELSNIVNSLEIAHSQGLLENTEVFMFIQPRQPYSKKCPSLESFLTWYFDYKPYRCTTGWSFITFMSQEEG